MSKLEFVTDNDIRTQLDYDDARRRYALHISDTLLDIVSRIQNIPEDELAKSIDKSKKKLFYKYLEQLQTDAKDIEQLAQKYELEKLPSKLEDVHMTCNNCHSHLRSYP
ncbi:MAG: hypothetical protein Q9M34_00210 [Sulfurimonas sp.]|nr:hypothetical protein [Sulfurimonas sp.]